MKTICLKIFLFLLVFQNSPLYAQSASVQPAPGSQQVSPEFLQQSQAAARDTMAHVAGAPVTHSTPPGCSAYSLSRYGLDQLQIMGKSLIELEPNMVIDKCVNASNDAAARRACGPSYSTIVNPLNPQYGTDSLDASLASLRGSRTSNEDGLYYCVRSPRTIPQIKAARCSAANDDRSCSAGRYSFVYTGEGRSREGVPDGDCIRTREGVSLSKAESLVCASSIETMSTDLSSLTVVPPIIPTEDAAAEPTAAAAAAPASADPTSALNQCIGRWRTRGQACKTGAEDAVRQCADTQSHNNAINGASTAIGALGNGVSIANQGQGTQGTCFEAGAAALAARAALDTTKQQCAAGETFCSGSCQVSQMDNFYNECLRAAGYQSLEQLRAEHSDMASNLESAKTEITEFYSQGADLCTNQVRTKRMSLDSVVSDLGRSLQASTICACQTSATTGTNCSQIPTIDVCQSNPASLGCQAYVPISTCAAGSPYYNAQSCACARNGAAPGCTAANTPPSVSSFATNAAGANLPQASGGSVSFGSAGGGGSSGSGSFDDLSGGGGSAQAALANYAGNIKAGEISTAGGSTGGTVGGGGAGASSGGSSGAAAPAAPPAEKGIGGLFKDLKNVFTNAFGGGGSKTPASTAKGNGTIDTNRFRPPNQGLRGGPQARDIASANEKTLFELVNDCANGLRCKTAGGYLQSP